jgi:hypothetical protein
MFLSKVLEHPYHAFTEVALFLMKLTFLIVSNLKLMGHEHRVRSSKDSERCPSAPRAKEEFPFPQDSWLTFHWGRGELDEERAKWPEETENTD